MTSCRVSRGWQLTDMDRRKHDAITRALVQGRLDEAEAELDTVLDRDSGNAQALALRARAAGLRGDRPLELLLIERAVDRDGDNGEYLAMLAGCRARGEDADGAEAAMNRALSRRPLSDIALDTLAGTLARAGRHREAVALLEEAIAAESKNPAIAFNLGNYLKFVGEFDRARMAYRQAIALAPTFSKAHAALSSLGGSGSDEEHLKTIERLIDACRDPQEKLHLRHAASKRCDAFGWYDASWTHLAAGKREWLAASGADPRCALRGMDRLCRRLDEPVDLPDRQNSAGPILVLGMPRSGTTVLDRLVSNHDGVVSIGESLYFAQLVMTAAGSRTLDLLDDRVIDAIEDGDLLRDAGRRYEQRGHAAVGTGQRFLDKFHLNILLAPHLLRAMPGVRLLCVVRDPLDTIVGNFRQQFELQSNVYRYSLDIEAAAEFYVRFRRIADRLERLAPDRFRKVSYERLIADPEREAADIFDFCDLPWQAGCSRIELNAASVATASAVQVRSGINASYMGRWRRYEKHLTGAIAILGEAGLLEARRDTGSI